MPCGAVAGQVAQDGESVFAGLTDKDVRAAVTRLVSIDNGGSHDDSFSLTGFGGWSLRNSDTMNTNGSVAGL
jgi:hypothetical protein